MTVGAGWTRFAEGAPELAAFGAGILARPRGVAYLATVAADGYPRVHPVTPFIGDGRLFVFTEPTSPKARDLRDRRDLETGGRFVVEVVVPQLRRVPPGEAGRIFTLDADHVGIETFDDLVGQVAWSHHWMEWVDAWSGTPPPTATSGRRSST